MCYGVVDVTVALLGGQTEQNCSQCHKRIVVEGMSLESFPLRMSTVFSPVENERYIIRVLGQGEEQEL